MELTNEDRADSILINMSKAELVDLTYKYHPHASLPFLRGYTKRELRGLIVRAIPAEVLLREEAPEPTPQEQLDSWSYLQGR